MPRFVIDTDSEDYEKRMQVARQRSTWELGSPGYAGLLIGAFLYPVEDKEALNVDQARYDEISA